MTLSTRGTREHRVKVAVVGLGVMGRNHLRLLRELPEAEVVGLCDPNPPANEDDAVSASIDMLLAQGKPELAVVAVPTPAHREVAIRLMDEGIAVLIEKPVAATVAQAREVLDAARRTGVPTAVGHVERFNPVVRALRNELKSKEVLSITIARIGPYPPRIADVGILSDLAVHDIDLIRFITGAEIAEGRIYRTRKIDHHFEDNAALSFKLADGTVASITTNWLTPFKKRRVEVATKDAYYEADLISQELTEYSRYTEHSQYHENSSFVTRKCIVPRGEPLLEELKALIALVRDGRRCDLATIEDSLLTLELIDRFGDRT